MRPPVRPSAAKSGAQAAAARMAGGELERIVIKVPAETRRALKARAARLGITFAAYVVRLAQQDGVDVVEVADAGGVG